MNFRSRRVLIGGGVALLFVVLVVMRIVQASAGPAPDPTVEQIRDARGVPVVVAPVREGELAVWREFSGDVSGTREAVVRARSDDQVSAVNVAVGDRVRTGQPLVRIASEGAAARVRQAEASLRQAERNVQRMRPLHEAGAISDQEWEQSTTQLELARADLASARDPLVLTSPMPGTVTEVIARPGMVPRSGDALVRVADLSQLVVYLQVSAAEAAEIREGQPARFAGGATGRVQRIALQADPATRLVEVQVAFPPTAGLIPGTLATVRVQVASRPSAVQVPRTAVRDGAFVWVVTEASTASRRRVELGLQGADLVEVLGGLALGERVVVEGGALLSEGAQVRIVGADEG